VIAGAVVVGASRVVGVVCVLVVPELGAGEYGV